MNNHSPLPWEVDTSRHSDSIIANDGDHLLQLEVGQNIRPYLNPDDAKFIVRAVNSHEKLVALITEAVKKIDLFHRTAKYHTKEYLDDVEKWLIDANQVIAEARVQ